MNCKFIINGSGFLSWLLNGSMPPWISSGIRNFCEFRHNVNWAEFVYFKIVAFFLFVTAFLLDLMFFLNIRLFAQAVLFIQVLLTTRQVIIR
jgi:hypothetical protein